jgi:hypothetical protein
LRQKALVLEGKALDFYTEAAEKQRLEELPQE